MKYLPLTTFLFIFFTTAAVAVTQPAIIFTQDVVAIDVDGRMLPPQQIEPETMAGMQTLDFDLGRGRLLRVQTNITNAGERGLEELVATVKRCYQYLESSTGRRLERGVMLYLIELDEIPYAYSFRAAYNSVNQWSEVRLALIDRGAPLVGPQAASSLTDLLYDTLPHELSHDLLDGIPQLMHDIDGNASNHTRWFIEGICEVLAKGFSRREAPLLYKHFIALRNVGSVLADKRMHNDLLSWSQHNNNGMALESDLYGAAMLTMLTWTETTPLVELLEHLVNSSEPVYGRDLIALMQKTTGIGPHELLNRAHNHGRRLNDQILLAQLVMD